MRPYNGQIDVAPGWAACGHRYTSHSHLYWLDSMQPIGNSENESIPSGRPDKSDAERKAFLGETGGHSRRAQIEKIDEIRAVSKVCVPLGDSESTSSIVKHVPAVGSK
jgi:hypothetical protein